MREIKFRAKENGNGPWRYGTYRYVKYSPVNGKQIDQHSIQTDEFEVVIDRNTLGQFTGKTDKNGKEIYEGDIVREGSQIGTIKWDEEFARYICVLPVGSAGLYLQQMKVIDNIHDNPEPLEIER